MAIITIEAHIKDGQVLLPGDMLLPDRAKVYVVIPDADPETIVLPPLPLTIHLRTPRLVNPGDATRLQKIIVTDTIEDGS